jgi:IS1 family transposase
MNKLSASSRAQILKCLVEGNSIRATCRLTGAAKGTVTRLLIDAGRACSEFQDYTLRDLNTRRCQVDEIWSFVYCKERNHPRATAAPETAGDVWTWTAIDTDSKLAISWLVADRSPEACDEFLRDTYERLANRVQLTSDGYGAYIWSMREVFGDKVDFAQLVKTFGAPPEAPAFARYSPPIVTGIKKTVRTGNPDERHISTSYVERQNLTMRMQMRRFTRLTNAFSKKVENHALAVSLHFMNYNFCRKHQTLKMTPAMAAGLTDRIWTVADIVKLVEEREVHEAVAKRQAMFLPPKRLPISN